MKVGITQLVLPAEWSFAEALDKIKSFGYEAFEPVIRDDGEVTPDTPTGELAKLARLAKAKGIALVSTLPVLSSFTMNVLSDDEATRKASIEMTKKLLRASAGLGVDAMLHTLCFPLPPDLYYDVAFEQGVKSLKELAPFCEEVGVRIAVEYVWNKFLNSPLDMRDFLDAVGSPWVGFYYDPGNMCIHSHSHQWARICGKHVMKVHAKDFKFVNWSQASFPALLTGDVDFAAVMRELRAIGFDGALVSEIGPSEASYEKTAEDIRRIMAM
jgi:hexulose-6-phosphate isomerase